MIRIAYGGRWSAAASLAAVLLGMGCGSATQSVECGGTERADGRERILFIGNSLTYSNALPFVVRALADSAGELPPEIEMVALPDFGLAEHWTDGQAARAIRGACWDVVVLQQGPSSLPESRALLLDYAARFAGLIREQGARPALLSVWPAESRRADFPRAIESYRLAAAAVDGQYLPAAAAWLEAWTRDPALQLYADGLHPSVEGTYLSALVTVGALYDIDPTGLPSAVSIRPEDGDELVLRVDDADAAVLRQAARAALQAAAAD